jgi:hypothetical protein
LIVYLHFFHKASVSKMQVQHDMANTICQTFRQKYTNSYVRFARTCKIDVRFIAQIIEISWTHCKRKGGGFTIWLSYKGNKARSHHMILREMVVDYSDKINELIFQGHKLKPVKNKSINPSKDLEILCDGLWSNISVLFPIEIRELRQAHICNIWSEINNIDSDIDIYRKSLENTYYKMIEK